MYQVSPARITLNCVEVAKIPNFSQSTSGLRKFSKRQPNRNRVRKAACRPKGMHFFCICAAFLQPATNGFVARQVDHARWKTRKIDPKLATKQFCATSWGFLYLVFRRLKGMVPPSLAPQSLFYGQELKEVQAPFDPTLPPPPLVSYQYGDIMQCITPSAESPDLNWYSVENIKVSETLIILSLMGHQCTCKLVWVIQPWSLSLSETLL